jgi:hypothetical protein
LVSLLYAISEREMPIAAIGLSSQIIIFAAKIMRVLYL